MGLIKSRLSVEDKKRRDEEIVQSRLIDLEHEKVQAQEMSIVKLLLLGAGESGKSTLFKQVFSLFGKGWTPKERVRYLEAIFNNLVDTMQIVCRMSEELSGSVDGETRVLPKNEKLRLMILAIDPLTTTALSPSIVDAWKTLLQDPGIQKTLDLRTRYQLLDSADYFFGKIDEVTSPGYSPTDDDIMRTRIKTTGVIETDFVFLGTKFRMVDVGGQRSERKKWIHCFDSVTAVIFVSAISEFDQKCAEDNETNRLDESLDLFNQICNSKFLRNTAMILFLNKSDLLRKKLEKGVSLKSYNPEYSGDNSFVNVVDTIMQLFLEQNLTPSRKIYTHVTCATSQDNVTHVFHAVKDIVVSQNMLTSGFGPA